MSDWNQLKRTARGVLSLLSTLPEIVSIDTDDFDYYVVECDSMPKLLQWITLPVEMADGETGFFGLVFDASFFKDMYELDSHFVDYHNIDMHSGFIITNAALDNILAKSGDLLHPNDFPQWVLALHTIYYGRVYVADDLGIIYPVHLHFENSDARLVMIGDPITPQHIAKWQVNKDARQFNSALRGHAYPILMFDDPTFWKGAKHKPKTEDERAFYISELKANAEEMKAKRQRDREREQAHTHDFNREYEEARKAFEDFVHSFWGKQHTYTRADRDYRAGEPVYQTPRQLTQVQQYAKVLDLTLPCRDVKALKKAYRAAALKTHPDTNGEQSTADFQAVNEAYAYLLRCFEEWDWKVLQ